MTSPWSVVKHVGPKLVPFFKSIAVFFVLFPEQDPSSLLYIILKCVPIAALCLFVLMHGINFQFEYSYSRRIFTGLLFSMVGDACLVYEEYFIPGMISFGIAHVIYLSAFGIRPFNFRLALALVACAVPACAFYIPFIKDYLLKVAVPLYLTLLLSMLWRAVSRLQIFNKEVEWTWTKLCCSLGAACFVVSDTILSFDMFIYRLPYSHQLIMSTYYAAQFGIALSVVDSYECHEVNHLVIQHQDLVKGVKNIFKSLKSSINGEDHEEKVFANGNSKNSAKGVKAN